MRLAIVVQRYGLEITGGAELHARYIAEHLSKHVEVEVLTTCARDYVTWRNELPAGIEWVNEIPVRRFPVERERDPEDFGKRSENVFGQRHSIAAELRWLDSEGPTSPQLTKYVRESCDLYDYFIFFSYRYYHSYHGARAVHHKSLLVPTAERDPAVGLQIFQPVFRGVRALMYNSFEERAMIQGLAQNEDVPGVVVGVGSEVPPRANPQRFRHKYGLTDRFAIYVGRIDENKGCPELFRHFTKYAASHPKGGSLVLVGGSILPIPEHPRIRHLGFLPDADKFDGMAAAEVLIMPSYYESLSMVALEAWGLGKPVLANAKCDVLHGQCVRSNAGLYYEEYEEFDEALTLLMSDRRLNTALGKNGREYFQRHYVWPVIERKYLDMLDRLASADRENSPSRGIEPLPNLFRRWRRIQPPAAEVLAALAAGPVRLRSRERAVSPAPA